DALPEPLPPVVVSHDAHRYDLARHVEYIEDPTTRMTLSEAMAPENTSRYRPAAQQPGYINLGFSHSAYWLRFKVAAPGERAEWLLEIGHPPLDRVEIYVPDESGVYALHVLGDTLPFSARPYPHRNLVLPIVFPGGNDVQTVYLRVTMEGTLTIPLNLWEPQYFAQQDEARFGWLICYLGALGALMLYNLMLYTSVRERVYLYYVGAVAGMIIAQASYAGLGFQYLWPAWPWFAHFSLPLWMAVAAILSCFFTREFLGTRAYRAIDRLVLGFVAVFGLAILALLAGFYQTSVYINVIGAACGGVTSIGVGLYCLHKGQPGARYYLIARSLLGIGVTTFSLRMLGWLPSVWITTYALQIGSALEMLLLAFALADRINTMRREKDAAQEQALQARDIMLKTLQTSEMELEARIEARTRELKLANRLLRERERDLQHLAHHDPLTGLANRVLLRERMHRALAQRRREGGMLAVLSIDLDNFKLVNDEYGHAVGDRLLVAIGHRFTAAMREIDTVARIGGDEFVVLIEHVHDLAAVESVAEKLRDAAMQPFEVNELRLFVAGSVGTAIYPHDGEDMETLLAMADASMYGAKKGVQRNQGEAGVTQQPQTAP
ncbi:MAG TPA: diguanylate cyclase, partial [Burkholderiales bacterium]